MQRPFNYLLFKNEETVNQSVRVRDVFNYIVIIVRRFVKIIFEYNWAGRHAPLRLLFVRWEWGAWRTAVT